MDDLRKFWRYFLPYKALAGDWHRLHIRQRRLQSLYSADCRPGHRCKLERGFLVATDYLRL